MQVFERRDWVAAQVQQQADSYAQSLACSLLAAGHRPPEWLLPTRVSGPQQGAFFPTPLLRLSGWVSSVWLGFGNGERVIGLTGWAWFRSR
jgi:hypothetical protein